MPNEGTPSAAPADARFTQADVRSNWNRVVGRRSFLKGVGVAGAVTLPGGAILASQAMAQNGGGGLTDGDVAILRFLAAVELIESDLWQQYNELGGVAGGNAAYMAALSNLDGDMPQYISDNTDDELSHAAFLNSFLTANGADQVNLDDFRTLPSSTATGAQQVGRLTNLQSLNVDTSWYVRYRSGQSPDFGATFPQAVTINNEPAIPVSDTDTPPDHPQPGGPIPPGDAQAQRMQAIANTAGFHFAYVEQGGSSLYSTMALKASSLQALLIVVSIGGVETNHFSLWHDKAGNAVAQPLAGVVDPDTNLTFPDLNAKGGELNQTNLILPEPCEFISPNLPACSVVRSTAVEQAGAVATIESFTADKLFEGQVPAFFSKVMKLARDADAAQRRVGSR
jgi:hypothetical protein